MPDKLLDLKNDLVFQRLFGNPKNKEITGHLLSLILNREIYNVDLDANKMFLGENANAKTGRLDVRVKFNDGEDCNIELQVQPFKRMESRMLQYWANMYSYKIHSGEKYEVLKPSISILIANYRVDKSREISHYHSIWNLREQNHNDLKLTNDIELHILEIPKVENSKLQNDELAQWLKFIANPEDEEVHKFMGENKYYKQAREELAYLSGDENFMRLVESRAMFLMDQEIEKYESEISKAKKIARKMKEKKMPIEDIAEITELSEEEIRKL